MIADVRNSSRERALEDSLRRVPGFEQGRKRRANIVRLGELIRELRKSELGITQTEAAKLIGMEQSELSRIENGFGRRGPSYLTITRIIDAYRGYLQSKDPSYRLDLNLTLSHGEAAEVEQNLLAKD